MALLYFITMYTISHTHTHTHTHAHAHAHAHTRTHTRTRTRNNSLDSVFLQDDSHVKQTAYKIPNLPSAFAVSATALEPNEFYYFLQVSVFIIFSQFFFNLYWFLWLVPVWYQNLVNAVQAFASITTDLEFLLTELRSQSGAFALEALFSRCRLQ